MKSHEITEAGPYWFRGSVVSDPTHNLVEWTIVHINRDGQGQLTVGNDSGEWEYQVEDMDGEFDGPIKPPSQRAERIEIIESVDRAFPSKPEGMTEADELAWALARVLRWPDPAGTIIDTLPGWLAGLARAALRRYITRQPQP